MWNRILQYCIVRQPMCDIAAKREVFQMARIQTSVPTRLITSSTQTATLTYERYVCIRRKVYHVNKQVSENCVCTACHISCAR